MAKGGVIMVHRKIEMKLVKKKNARMVTFSKRRSGIFKKAYELSILCGAQVGMIVFSPGGKPFAFGHPTIEAVINKFLHQGPQSGREHVIVDPSKSGNIGKLNKQLEDMMNQVQVGKKKWETLDNALNKDKLTKGKIHIDGLDVEGLQKLKASLEELSGGLKLSMKVMEAASSLLLLAENPVKETDNWVGQDSN